MLQTETIDIEHVRLVLQNCPNYDEIINYEYPYGDNLSRKLIDWYRELIFSAKGDNEKELLLIRALDKSLYLYVRDNRFKRGLKKIINDEELVFSNKELIKDVIKRLIEYTNNYEKREVLDVSVSKWL